MASAIVFVMDQKLVSWARSVKRRLGPRSPPPLWLFSDPSRMPDLLATAARLPAGLCGLVFRHDDVPGRAELGRRLAALCRRRRVPLVSAGAPVPGAGLHLRGGRHRRGPVGLRTASAHGRVELVRASRAGASLVFLSPAYPTLSHPGARALGPIRWAALARTTGAAVMALGGLRGSNVRRLGRHARGIGAIGALAEP